MVDMTDIHHQIHLNHACDATPPHSRVVGVVVLVKKISDLHLYWDYLDFSCNGQEII